MDPDSTVFCREEKQEGARKGRNSHHPLLTEGTWLRTVRSRSKRQNKPAWAWSRRASAVQDTVHRHEQFLGCEGLGHHGGEMAGPGLLRFHILRACDKDHG